MGKVLSLNIKTFKIDKNDNLDNKQFLPVEFYAISEGINRNQSAFTEESLNKAIPSLINKPILAFFDKNEITSDGLGDFTEHIMDVKYDKTTNDTYFDTLKGERPIGIIPESSEIKIVDYQGKKFLTFTGLIWAKYNKYAVDLLNKRRTNTISVEIEVQDSKFDENEIEWIHEFSLTGVTLLGKNYSPGIENAHLRLADYVESEQYQQFKKVINFALKGGENKNVFGDLTANQLRRRLNTVLSSFTYDSGEYEYQQYWLDDFNDSVVYVQDNQDNKYYQINYTFENDEIVFDMDSKIQVEETYKPVTFAQKILVYLEKDKWGTGDALKVDKSAKSVSDDAWGNISKTDLMNKVLEASNYKTLIHDVYLYVGSDWETSPTGDSGLKYPVMQIKDGKLVYNKNGISKALGYAEAQKETEVVSKAKALQKKLKLDSEDKHMKYSKGSEGEKMNFKEVVEKDGKFKYIAEAENYVLAYCLETKRMSMIPFVSDDEGHMEMKTDELKMVSLLAKVDGEEDKVFDMGNSMSDMMEDMMDGGSDEQKEQMEMMSKKVEELSAENNTLMSEKEALMAEKVQLNSEKEVLMTEKTKATEDKEFAEKAIREYKEKEMFEELARFAEEKSMSEEEKKEFSDKIKDFADVKEFKKDMIYSYHEKHEDKNNKHLKMGGFLRNPKETKKPSPFEKLQEI